MNDLIILLTKGLLVSIVYLFIIFIVFALSYNKKEKIIKLNYKKILLFSLMFTILSFIVIKFSTTLHGDRYNYYIEFLGYRSTSSGLTFIFDLIKRINGNFFVLGYFITFTCTFILFLSLKINIIKSKETILFVLFTDIIFFTFSVYKQCYTNMFSALFFAVLFNKKIKYKNIICIALIALCCAFHSTGYILIPIYILMVLYQNKKMKIAPSILIVLIFIVFQQNILQMLSNTFINIIPQISNKIQEYFYTEAFQVSSTLVFVKGIPFYLVTIIGLFKYKKLNKIENYEKYLLLSIIGSTSYLFSIFSYWMYRFTLLFYLPTAMLFSVIIDNETNGKNRWLFKYSIYGFELLILIRWVILMYTRVKGF